MKKRCLFFILFIGCCYYVAFSQNEINYLSETCVKDTTLIKIEKIEEYCLNVKSLHKVNRYIIVYVMSGRYADLSHRNYNKELQIVSLDTIVLQKRFKPFVKVNGYSYTSRIEVDKTYLFHLELSGCFPIVLGSWLHIDYYDFDDIRLPISICPLQPYKAIELKGLNYDGIHVSSEYAPDYNRDAKF